MFSDRSAVSQHAHRPFMLGNISNWSWGEWAAILAIGGFLVALKILGAPSAIEKQQLRSQFRLPEDVALSQVYVRRSSSKPFPADIEGIVQFSEMQFRKYISHLSDPDIWRPIPIVHGGNSFHGPYERNALAWRDLVGVRPLAWGSLSGQQAQSARNGLYICFSVRDDGSGYRGVQCPGPGSTTVRAAIVQGLLDFDTFTLHMLIRQTRPGL